MADQTIPDYETISAAVTGETWAVEKVLMCYKDEIDRQATVKKRQPDGTFKLEIDEDMRQDRSCGDMAAGTGSNKIFLPQENPLPEPDRKRITAEAGNAG